MYKPGATFVASTVSARVRENIVSVCSGNHNVREKFLIAVERIEIVVAVKVHRRAAVGGLRPLIVIFYGQALALHDWIGSCAIELDEIGPRFRCWR